MKAYGIKLHQGSKINNANIQRGSSFPTTEMTPGQLFFKQNENKMYYRDKTNTQWVLLESASGTSIVLNDIIDVDADTPDQDDVLTFNGTNWESLPTQTILSLDDIPDVDADSPSPGQTLTWDGNNWIPVDPDEGSVSTVTNNSNGTYTHNDGRSGGVSTVIDTRASSNPYDNTSEGILSSTNVQSAIDEIISNANIFEYSMESDNQAGNDTFTFPHKLGVLEVYLNGTLLSSAGFTEDGSTGFTLASPVSDNADVIIAKSREIRFT